MQLFFDDILKFCEKVDRYAASSQSLHNDELVYDAILRNLELIGEAANRIPIEVQTQIPEVDWKSIRGFRNWIAHGYFRLSEDIIMDAIQQKVPELSIRLMEFRRDNESLFADVPA